MDQRYTALYLTAISGVVAGEYLALRGRDLSGIKPDGTVTAHCRALTGQQYTPQWWMALTLTGVGAVTVLGHIFWGKPW